MIRVIPVLDVRGGVVVHGIAGQRAAYRPIVSRLTSSTAPLDVARAFREQLGLDELYVADLDALVEGRPNVALHRALAAVTPKVWVDAGLRSRADADSLINAGVGGLVAALESLDSPDALRELVAVAGGGIIFSLDLRGGQLVARGRGWTDDPLAVVAQAVACGVRRLLVLDVGQVGLAGGTGTEELCRRLSEAFPDVELATGGGIRNKTDLQLLQRCGVHAALVATALHEGGLVKEDIQDR